MSDDGQRFSRFNREANVVQHPLFILIGEPDIAKLNAQGPRRVPGHGSRPTHRLGRQAGNLAGCLFLRGSIQQSENSLATRHCGLQNVVFLAQVLDRPEDARPILQESHDDAHRHQAFRHTVSAIQEKDAGSECPEPLDRRIEPGMRSNRPAMRVTVFDVDVVELFHAFALVREELDDLHP